MILTLALLIGATGPHEGVAVSGPEKMTKHLAKGTRRGQGSSPHAEQSPHRHYLPQVIRAVIGR